MRSLDDCVQIQDKWIRLLTDKQNFQQALSEKSINLKLLSSYSQKIEMENKKQILSEPDRHLKIGEHIIRQSNKLLYEHHGVYIGQGQIVHFFGRNLFEKQNARIIVDTLDNFIKDDYSHFYVRKYAVQPKNSEEIVDTALQLASLPSQGQYSLLENNCEHFSTQVIMDCKMSLQINNAHESLKNGAKGMTLIKIMQSVKNGYKLGMMGSDTAVAGMTSVNPWMIGIGVAVASYYGFQYLGKHSEYQMVKIKLDS